ncbi:hypothetical protein F8S13_18650 [Chloroflexia bacterium SDU3-3]|nr:hypothetical protein F8S13_18650 [Chloroflexia bacterium SDU3-3]
MATRCPECGASFSSGETCQDHFNTTQSLEFENPDYFAAHHLSVPSYLLQHHHYTREGWIATRSLLHSFITQGVSAEEARRQTQDFSGGLRPWKWAGGGQPLEETRNIMWSRTMADVRYDTPEQYLADVRAWAEAILADTEDLVRSLGAS